MITNEYLTSAITWSQGYILCVFFARIVKISCHCYSVRFYLFFSVFLCFLTWAVLIVPEISFRIHILLLCLAVRGRTRQVNAFVYILYWIYASLILRTQPNIRVNFNQCFFYILRMDCNFFVRLLFIYSIILYSTFLFMKIVKVVIWHVFGKSNVFIFEFCHRRTNELIFWQSTSHYLHFIYIIVLL